jgi:hypothetical protein
MFGLPIVIGTLKFLCKNVLVNHHNMQLFIDSMPRDTFHELRTNLHLVDNTQIPAGNKDQFYKVWPLFSAVQISCLQLPVEEQSPVDKAMVPCVTLHNMLLLMMRINIIKNI